MWHCPNSDPWIASEQNDMRGEFLGMSFYPRDAIRCIIMKSVASEF